MNLYERDIHIPLNRTTKTLCQNYLKLACFCVKMFNNYVKEKVKEREIKLPFLSFGLSCVSGFCSSSVEGKYDITDSSIFNPNRLLGQNKIFSFLNRKCEW